MINTTIEYDNIIIIIVASAPASTRPDPRGRGQDPRGQSRGHTILALEIQQILNAIKKNFIEIYMLTNFQCEIASNYKCQPIIKYLKSIP